MNRGDFQRLADRRIHEAKILLDSHCYEGAYYLAGYAAECALKAVVAKQIQAFDFPDKKFVNSIYTHDLEKLLELSNLKSLFESHCKSQPKAQIFWSATIKWTEEQRYATSASKLDAQGLYEAITDSKDGILTWLKTQW